jgi:hypothetical protein
MINRVLADGSKTYSFPFFGIDLHASTSHFGSAGMVKVAMVFHRVEMGQGGRMGAVVVMSVNAASIIMLMIVVLVIAMAVRWHVVGLSPCSVRVGPVHRRMCARLKAFQVQTCARLESIVSVACCHGVPPQALTSGHRAVG